MVNNFETLDHFSKTPDSGSNVMNDHEVREYLRNLVFKAFIHIRFILFYWFILLHLGYKFSEYIL